MKKTLAALALFFGVVSSSYAFFYLAPYLLAGTNMMLAAGTVLDYFMRDVKTSSTAAPTRIYIKLNPQATEDPKELPSPSGAASYTPSATAPLQAVGGSVATKVFTYNSSSPGQTQAAQFPWQVTATTVDEALAQLEQVPPIKGGGDSRYVPISFSYNKANTPKHAASTVTQTRSVLFVNGVPTLRVSNYYPYNYCVQCGGVTETIDFTIPDVTCPAGYSLRADKSTCDLTDVNAASAPTSLRDSKCILQPDGAPNPFDPDCAALQSAGAFSSQVASNGRPVNVVKDPSGASSDTTAISARPPGTKHAADPGGTDVSQTTKNPDGSTTRQDAQVDKPTQPGEKAKVGDVGSANYPVTPPPLYPGQVIVNAPSPSGTGSGTSGTGSGSTCGGPYQPPCDVKAADGFFDGLLDKLGLGGDNPSQPPETGADQKCDSCDENVAKKEAFFDTVLGFSNLELPIPEVSCSSAFSQFDRSVTMFEHSFEFKMSPVCDLMNESEALIRALFLLAWSLLGVFIILEKVE